jgi:hypothetical protein
VLPCCHTLQVFLNYRRQSTEGWNVHNVLLDFGGGLLSLVQVGGWAGGWVAEQCGYVRAGQQQRKQAAV